jgi:hypothetical protein
MKEEKKMKNFNNNKKKRNIDGFFRTRIFRHQIVLPTLTRRKDKTEKKQEREINDRDKK